MDTTIEQLIHNLLEELSLSSRSIRGCLLATADGVAVSHRNLPAQCEALAALSASVLGIGRKVTDVGDCGSLEEISFKGFDGWISVIAVGNRAVLTTVAYEGCSIEMVTHYSRKYADQILEKLDPEQARSREEREEARDKEEYSSMQSALRALASMDPASIPIREEVEQH